MTTYSRAIEALGAGDRVVVMPGVESTPNTLWFRVPGEQFPKTLGHFNFWPLTSSPSLPRGGAPIDERLEPGALMDAIEPLWADLRGRVRQMNHPFSAAKLGRDEGFLRVIGYDPRAPLNGSSFAAEVMRRRPGGGHRNLDFDIQEVMTGASRRLWLRGRMLWFSLLNEGIAKAGTANSDSHDLATDVIGYPRNLVAGGHSVAGFQRERFNEDVKVGRLIGTNGPVLEVDLVDPANAEGQPMTPALTPVSPAVDAVLRARLTVLPWIPVSELRVIVNGAVALTVPVGFDDGRDPFGGERSLVIERPLGPLLAGVDGDAWLLVEAGLPLPRLADLDQDGIPDTSDNNGDGDVDDVDRGDHEEDSALPDPGPVPATDARFHLQAIAPGTWPYAFSNPFLLDRDGGGWQPRVASRRP